MNKSVFYILFLLVFICFGCQNETIDIYVSPLGNNSNNGTKLAPFVTLEKALENAQSLERDTVNM